MWKETVCPTMDLDWRPFKLQGPAHSDEQCEQNVYLSHSPPALTVDSDPRRPPSLIEVTGTPVTGLSFFTWWVLGHSDSS